MKHDFWSKLIEKANVTPTKTTKIATTFLLKSLNTQTTTTYGVRNPVRSGLGQIHAFVNKKKLSTILKRTYQLKSYLLIIPIMLHHFRINLLLSATMKHNSRNRDYARIRWTYLSRSSCTQTSIAAGHINLLWLLITASII